MDKIAILAVAVVCVAVGAYVVIDGDLVEKLTYDGPLIPSDPHENYLDDWYTNDKIWFTRTVYMSEDNHRTWIERYKGGPDVYLSYYISEFGIENVYGICNDDPNIRTVYIDCGHIGVYNCFNNCPNLESVVITGSQPDREYAGSTVSSSFNNCPNLKSIQFPTFSATINNSFNGLELETVVLNGLVKEVTGSFQSDAMKSLMIEAPVKSFDFESIPDGAEVVVKNLDADIRIDGQVVYNMARSSILHYFGDIDTLYIPKTVTGDIYVKPTLAAYDVDPENETYESREGVLYKKTEKQLYRFPPNYRNGTLNIGPDIVSIDEKAFLLNGVTSFPDWIEVDAENTKFTSIDGILYSNGYWGLCLLILPGHYDGGALYIRGDVYDLDPKAFQGAWPSSVTISEDNKYFAVENGLYMGKYRIEGAVWFDIIFWSDPDVDKDGLVLDKSAVCGLFRNDDTITKMTVDGHIEANLFMGCDSLKTLVVKGNMGDNSLLGADSVELLDLTDATWGSYEPYLPSSLKKVIIGENCDTSFAGCTSLEEVVFLAEDTLKIRDGAFSGCTSLRSVTMNASYIEIGASAFFGCSALTEIEIPDDATVTIGTMAFANCTSIEVLDTEDWDLTMGEHAFKGCSNLTYVDLNENVVGLGLYVFEDCPLETIVLRHDYSDLYNRHSFSKALDFAFGYYVDEVKVYQTGWATERLLEYMAIHMDDGVKIIIIDGMPEDFADN